MVGKWMEGFETHMAEEQLARKYATQSGTVAQRAGRVHGNAGGPNSLVLVTPSLGLSSTVIMGFGMRLATQQTTLNSGAQGFYFERGASEQCHIEIQSNAGSFELKLMRGSTQIGITTETFAYGAWHHFEVSVTTDPSSGAYEIRHNEVNVLSDTGVNLADSGSAQSDVWAMRFSSNVGAQLYLDDFYLIDTTGSTNNTFRGDTLVEGILPNANGATNAWTQNGSGDNYTSVDDPATSAPDDSGTGGTCGSDTNGQKDLYAYEDLTQIQGNIHFIQVGTQLGMAATGSRTVKSKYRDPDTTEADGDTHTVDSTQFDEFTEIMDENPAASAAWDVADINNGQFGVEVVS